MTEQLEVVKSQRNGIRLRVSPTMSTRFLGRPVVSCDIDGIVTSANAVLSYLPTD